MDSALKSTEHVPSNFTQTLKDQSHSTAPFTPVRQNGAIDAGTTRGTGCNHSPKRTYCNDLDTVSLAAQARPLDPEGARVQQDVIRHRQSHALVHSIVVTLLSAFVFTLTICLPYHSFSQPVFKAVASILTVSFMIVHQLTIAAPRDTLTASAA